MVRFGSNLFHTKSLYNVHTCEHETCACENVFISIEYFLSPFSLHQFVSIGFNEIEFSIEKLYLYKTYKIYVFLFPKNDNVNGCCSFEEKSTLTHWHRVCNSFQISVIYVSWCPLRVDFSWLKARFIISLKMLNST